MPNATEVEMIRKLRDRTTRGELNGIDVTYHVQGGSPAGQTVNDEVRLSGLGVVQARVGTPATTMRESSENMPRDQVIELLRQIGEGADGLIPRSEAAFIPDSVVGQVSVTIDGQEVSFFFLPDQAQAEQQGQVLSPGAAAAVGNLARVHKRILEL